MKYLFSTLLTLIFLLTPSLASAQFWGSLVQCGNDIYIVEGQCDAPNGEPGYQVYGECNFCDFVKLAANILEFLITFTVVAATIMFAYAGILYLTSGPNPGNISKAHGIFWSVFMGMIIVLAAFLIVRLVMDVLYNEGQWGPWNEILCDNEMPNGQPVCRQKNSNTVTGGVPPTHPPGRHCAACTLGGNTVARCGESYEQCIAQSQTCAGTVGPCLPEDPGSGDDGATLDAAAIAAKFNGTQQWASIIASEAAAIGISPDLYRAMMMIESGGDPSAVNGQHIGLMQIKIATARPFFPGLSDSQIRTELLNPQVNIELATAIIEESIIQLRRIGQISNDNIIAYHNGGPNAVLPSQHCPGLRAWKCPWDSLTSDGQSCYTTGRTDCTPNSGPDSFEETRRYVANSHRIMACLASGTCASGGEPDPPNDV